MTSRAATVALLILALLPLGSAVQQERKTKVGDTLAPFEMRDVDGALVRYEPAPSRATILSFVDPHQKRSERTIGCLVDLTARFGQKKHAVDLRLIVSAGLEIEPFEEEDPDLTVLLDAGDALWGRLGVVVTPTTFVVDERGTITWIRAGFGFDFALEAEAAVNRALRLQAASPLPEPAADPPAVASAEERAGRHVRMSRVFAQRGEGEAAVAELRMADDLAPHVATVRLELAAMLCREDRSDEALATAAHIRAETAAETAQLALVTGWAHRQLGDLDRAAARLNEAIALRPDSARAHYELGRVWEARGACEEAMASYRRALALQFGEPSAN